VYLAHQRALAFAPGIPFAPCLVNLTFQRK
jgi:hypothetical protein